MHKLYFFLLLLIALSSSAQNKKNKDRLFINLGAGPSYSLFYNSGGWVRDFITPNFNNITHRRTAWAFSHFGELEWRLKNRRWSLRSGYSMHNFSPAFKSSGRLPNGTYYDIDTREEDKYLYLQTTIHYTFLQWHRNRVEAGTGFYIQNNRRQGIEMDGNTIGPSGAGPIFLSKDYRSQEAGFPFNLDYTYQLNAGTGMGMRFNVNYTQSVQTFEHLAFQFFCKAKLN